MSKWISAEERLPEHDTDCWLNIPSERPERVQRGHFFRDPTICADGIWSFEQEHYCICAKMVTHWMLYYMPEAPSE